MTDERIVLALNSGSSSLKFGLYRIKLSRAEMLLSGEAASPSDKEAKFDARDARGNALVSETTDIPGQREAIIRIGRLLADAKVTRPAAT
jgi:acetate kinase